MSLLLLRSLCVKVSELADIFTSASLAICSWMWPRFALTACVGISVTMWEISTSVEVSEHALWTYCCVFICRPRNTPNRSPGMSLTYCLLLGIGPGSPRAMLQLSHAFLLLPSTKATLQEYQEVMQRAQAGKQGTYLETQLGNYNRARGSQNQGCSGATQTNSFSHSRLRLKRRLLRSKDGNGLWRGHFSCVTIEVMHLNQ